MIEMASPQPNKPGSFSDIDSSLMSDSGSDLSSLDSGSDSDSSSTNNIKLPTDLNKLSEQNIASENTSAEQRAAIEKAEGEQVPIEIPTEPPSPEDLRGAIEVLSKIPSNIQKVSDEARVNKLECKLESNQLLSNSLRTALVGGFYLTAGVLSLGTAGPLLATISAVAGNLPVAPTSIMPYAGKNTYYLGYMHSREKCLDTTDQGDNNLKGIHYNFEKYRTGKVSKFILPKQLSVGYVERGEAKNAQNGCFVWSLLTYQNAKNVRIIIFGGSTVRAAYDAYGFVSCSLEKDDNGKLFLVIIGYKAFANAVQDLQQQAPPEDEQLPSAPPLPSLQKGGGEETYRIPVHWQDQVQYVSCGIRPSQSKWHVNVEGGKVTTVTQKVSKPEKEASVYMPEKPLIMAKAKQCNVWFDGTFGPGTNKPEKQNVFKRLYKNFDYERLFTRSSKNRIEQHPFASPDNPNPAPVVDSSGKLAPIGLVATFTLAALSDALGKTPLGVIILTVIAFIFVMVSMLLSLIYLIKITYQAADGKYITNPLNIDTVIYNISKIDDLYSSEYKFKLFIYLPAMGLLLSTLALLYPWICNNIFSVKTQEPPGIIEKIILVLLFQSFIALSFNYAAYSYGYEALHKVDERIHNLNNFIHNKIYKNAKFLAPLKNIPSNSLLVSHVLQSSINNIEKGPTVDTLANSFFTLNLYHHFMKIGHKNKHIKNAMTTFDLNHLLIGSSLKEELEELFGELAWSPTDYLFHKATFIEDYSTTLSQYYLAIPSNAKSKEVVLQATIKVASWMEEINNRSNEIHPEESWKRFLPMAIIILVIQTLPLIILFWIFNKRK